LRSPILARRRINHPATGKIKLLRSMQGLGFSLTEIGQVLDGLRSSDIDCLDGARLLADKRQRIEEQIRDLREVSRTLRHEQKRLEGRAHRHGKQFDQ
jgi:DNA-binding transcriptional MerR regulator